MTETDRAQHVYLPLTGTCFWCGFSQVEIENANPRLRLCPDKRNTPDMTEEDRKLIMAFADVIRDSPAGRRLNAANGPLELAAVAHRAIKDRLPRDTR